MENTNNHEDNKNFDDLKVEIIHSSSQEESNICFKIIVIGDSGVGKSCLSKRLIDEKFDSNYYATIGFEFLSINVKINNEIIKLQVWDTCGQEIYRSLIAGFYRNSSMAIIVYSIDNYESFENINLWINNLKSNSSPDVKLILIGNKSDIDNNRQVSYKEGLELKEKHGFEFFLECSAKTGINAKEVFLEASKILYKNYLEYIDSISLRDDQKINNFNLFDENLKIDEPKKKRGCC